MIKKLFGFIGRKKRVNEKMMELSQLIGRLEGEEKINIALEVAERVAVAKNNKALEEIADFYIMQIKKPLDNHRD